MAFSWLYKPNRAMRRVAARLKNTSVGVMAMGQKREAIRPRMRVVHQFERLESRLHLNAADLDPTFGVGGRTTVNYLQSADDTVTRMRIMSDGRMVVGVDSVVTVNTTTTHTAAIARFLANGQPDPSFGVGGQILLPELDWYTGVKDIAIFPDGSIVAIGGSRSGHVRNVQKFTPTGAYDPGWVTQGTSYQDGFLIGVLALTNGKTIVVTPASMWRLNVDGLPDASFGKGGRVALDSSPDFNATTDVAQPDGSILVGGYRFPTAQAEVHRYKSDGTPDAGFGTGGIVALPEVSSNSTVNSLAIAADGTIGVAGYDYIARLHSNGLLDASFNGTGIQTVSEGSVSLATIKRLAVQADGSYIAAGYDSSAASPFVAHLLVDGSLDPNFGSGGVDYTPIPADVGSQGWGYDLGADSSGSLWFAGSGVAPGAPTRDMVLTHIQADGTLDPSVGPDSDALGDTLSPRSVSPGRSVMQPDGKLVMGGSIVSGAPAQFAVTRLNADGTLDTAFGVEGVGSVNFGVSSQAVYTVALQPDGKIVLAGSVSNPDPNSSTNRFYAFARFNADGTLDTTFGNAGTQQLNYGFPGQAVLRVLIAPDGSILGSDANHLLRLLPDGTPDSAFGSNGLVTTANDLSYQFITNFLVDSKGNIVIGGNIRSNNLVDSAFVARYRSDGSLDLGFGKLGYSVSDIGKPLLARDFFRDVSGNFYVCGAVGGSSLVSVTRFTASGAVDSTFGTQGTEVTAISGEFLAAVLAADGKMLLTGDRRSPTGNYDAMMLRLLPTGQIDSTFGVNGVLTMDFGGTDIFRGAFYAANGRIIVTEDSGTAWRAIRLMGADGDSSNPPVVKTASLRPDLGAVSFTFNENVAASTSVDSLSFTDASRKTPLKATSYSYDSFSNTATFGLPVLPVHDTFNATLFAAGVRNAMGTMLDGNGDGVAGDDYAYSFLSFIPPAPAVTSPTATTAHLTWTSYTFPDDTRISRSSDGANFTVIYSSYNAGKTSFDDSGLVPGTLYSYRIQAYQSPASSAWSNATGVIPLTTGDNSVYFKKDADGSHRDIWINSPTPGMGTPSRQLTTGQLTGVAIGGQAGNDTLTLDFSNGNPLPPGGITFDGGAGVNTLAIIGTSADDTLTATASGLALSNQAFGKVPINVANLQTIQFHGGSGGNDVLNITGGNYTLDADTPTGTPNLSVTVGAAGMVTFTSDQHLAGLAINDGHVNVSSATRKLLAVNALSLTGNAVLDVNLSDLLLGGGTPSSAVAQYLKQGYGSGTWNGPSGIISTAATNSNGRGTLGYAVGGDPVAPVIGAGQTLVRYTLPGDATLDGLVDIGDLNVVLSNYLKGKPGTWVTGDFTYAGQTDITDLNIVLSNYLKNTPATLAPAVATPPTTAPAAAAAHVQTEKAASIPLAPLIMKPVGDPPKRAALAATITPMVATPKPLVARKGTGRSTAAGDKLFSAVAVREQSSRDASLSVGSPSDTVLERVAGNSSVLRKLNRRQPWHKGT